MATGITNNLYPPIIDTYMPAFVRTQSCKIYFSLSSYNDIDDISNAQVIVSNQNSSLSALDSTQYPSQIMITTIYTDNTINTDYKYYIVLNPSDMVDGEFELNQYYKVQIRFTGTGATEVSGSTGIASWLVNNEVYFSEWSTVCLIRGIQQPFIYLKTLDDTENTTSTTFTLTSTLVELVGQMYYEENSDIEEEYMNFYNIQIYNASTELLVFDSGDIYTNESCPNEINYELTYALEDGTNYQLILTYTTINEYVGTATYEFSVLQNSLDALNATITATADNDNGRIIIEIVGTESFLGNLVIRRSSSESNFTIWQDVLIAQITTAQALDYTWYDYTCQSGIYYQYGVQRINAKGFRTTIVKTSYIMPYYDDMFLVNKDFQLRVKFDPTISSYKHNILETKTDTIGSKYPYIRRNGALEYKSFSISGLITAFCDEDNIFLSKDIIFGDLIQYYENFNDSEQITEYKDFLYEREFRNKIIDFLYDNSVKLFKSTPEGNILIKLMDISFSPVQSLGRMLYNFSATAYEIDECSIDNYDSYDIQNIGEYQSYVEYTYEYVGQYQNTLSGNLQDIIYLVQTEIDESTVSDYDQELLYLKWVRITFESDPYLIYTKETNPRKLVDGDTIDTSVAYGWIVVINGLYFIVSARGYIEFADEDTVITSIYFPEETTVTVDYIGVVNEVENTSILASTLYYYLNAGQIWGVFDVEDSISSQIYLKYYEDYNAYYQKLTSINRITVEAEPGSIIYVQDSFDDTAYKHIVGHTGVLEFYADDTTITKCYFAGVQLYEATDPDDRDIAEDEQFIETGITAATADEIDNPIKNGVYTINGERYIYYRSQWYNFSDDNEVSCPVYGLVDYIYEMVKGEY